MNINNINVEYLDKVVAGGTEDIWYHFGISSRSPETERICDVRAVVMSGSGPRAAYFAGEWSKKTGADIIRLNKEERFTFCYCGGIIFSSHGMGMPSASIALHELMKMVYYLKRGKLEEIDKITWLRVGTSGGFGNIEEGGVVVTTEALEMDLHPYRLLHGNKQIWFIGLYPVAVAERIAELGNSIGVHTITGKTLCSHDFYLETMRLDGAIIFDNETSRADLLGHYYSHGIRNNEMESGVVAGMLNHWGFSKFATICCIIIDRSKGDQVVSTPEQLAGYVNNSEKVLFAYLSEIMAE